MGNSGSSDNCHDKNTKIKKRLNAKKVTVIKKREKSSNDFSPTTKENSTTNRRC